jgi:hypothetical protein
MVLFGEVTSLPIAAQWAPSPQWGEEGTIRFEQG